MGFCGSFCYHSGKGGKNRIGRAGGFAEEDDMKPTDSFSNIIYVCRCLYEKYGYLFPDELYMEVLIRVAKVFEEKIAEGASGKWGETMLREIVWQFPEDEEMVTRIIEFLADFFNGKPMDDYERPSASC